MMDKCLVCDANLEYTKSFIGPTYMSDHKIVCPSVPNHFKWIINDRFIDVRFDHLMIRLYSFGINIFINSQFHKAIKPFSYDQFVGLVKNPESLLFL